MTKSSFEISSGRYCNFQAEDALDFLVDRRDFWSQQKPDYPNGPREEIGSRATWDAVVNRLVNKEPVRPFRAQT